MGKIDLVFYSESFTPLDGNNIRRALTIALNLAKIQDLHFHDLRYTFATWAAGNILLRPRRCTGVAKLRRLKSRRVKIDGDEWKNGLVLVSQLRIKLPPQCNESVKVNEIPTCT